MNLWKGMQKIPAGTFLVPMVISMLLYSFWPNLFKIGGSTEMFFGGGGVNFIIGFLVFASGTTVDIHSIGKTLKHHGSLLLFNAIWSILLSVGFLLMFGYEGIWGISGLGFVTVIMSTNPAVYLSIITEYGDVADGAIYPLSGILALPPIPLIIFSVYESGGFVGVDWMPIISVFLPLIAGMILGNIDKEFSKVFGVCIGALLPILGWSLGQSMNLFEAIESGLSGIIVTVFFLVLMIPVYFFDTKALKENGIMGLGQMTVAGVSTAVPAAVVSTMPSLQPYMTSATAQVLMACIITSVVMPILCGRRWNKLYSDTLTPGQIRAQKLVD